MASVIFCVIGIVFAIYLFIKIGFLDRNIARMESNILLIRRKLNDKGGEKK